MWNTSPRVRQLLTVFVGVTALSVVALFGQVRVQGDSNAPGNLVATAVSNGVSLSWDAPASNAAWVTGYEIRRRRPNFGENSFRIFVPDTGSTATSFLDTTATTPGRYSYRVVALRGSNKSGASNYARAIVESSQSVATPTPTATATPGSGSDGGSTATAVPTSTPTPTVNATPNAIETARAAATRLGDLTDETREYSSGSLVGNNSIKYHSFSITDTRDVALELLKSIDNPDSDVSIGFVLEDLDGTMVANSSQDENGNHEIRVRASAGTYYVRVQLLEDSSFAYSLIVSLSDPASADASDEAGTNTPRVVSSRPDADEPSSDVSSEDQTPTPTPTPVTLPDDADSVRAGARDLGDITNLPKAKFPKGTINGGDDTVDYFSFTLTEPKGINIGLRQLDFNADLFLENASGARIGLSVEAGTANEKIRTTLLEGTYYARVEAQEAGVNRYRFRHGVFEPAVETVSLLRSWQAPTEKSTKQKPSTEQGESTILPRSHPTPPAATTLALSTADGKTSGRQTGHSLTSSVRERWYHVTLASGDDYIIEVMGSGHDIDLTLVDPCIGQILDNNGDELGEGVAVDDATEAECYYDGGGFVSNSARAYVRNATAGTYSFSVVSGAQDRGGVGSYKVQVRKDDYSDDKGTDTEVGVGTTGVTGNIDYDMPGGDPYRQLRGIDNANDRDVFRVSLVSGTTYTLSISSTNTTLDGQLAILAVYDGIGNFLYPSTFSSHPEEASVEYTAGYSGIHCIEIGTKLSSSGQTGSYTLTVTGP